MSSTTPSVPHRGAPSSEIRFVLQAIAVQWRVLGAVYFKHAGLRRGRPFALGWLLPAFEPIIIIGAISTFFLMLNRQAAYGDSVLLLVGTGVFPMYLIIYTSMRVREAVAAGHQSLYPLETTVDEIIIHSLLHLVSTALVATAFFFLLTQIGVADAMPFDLMTALSALIWMFVLGVGFGVINSVIARFFPFWATLWPGLARAMIHFSGIYIVADDLSPNVRRYFDANPLLHGITWFRHGFYPFYPEATDHRDQLMLLALGTLALGLMLERVFRRGIGRGDIQS